MLAQIQRTRSLFGRDELDAARGRFKARKGEAYRTLDGATLDAAGKEHARRYLDAFYGAIESDEAFYRRVVTAPDTTMYATADGTPACPNANTIPIGTPVSDPLQTSGALIQVQLLDALWHWTSTNKCDAVRKGPVWIKADAVSADFPKRSAGR
jgi:hypothetical protein